MLCFKRSGITYHTQSLKPCLFFSNLTANSTFHVPFPNPQFCYALIHCLLFCGSNQFPSLGPHPFPDLHFTLQGGLRVQGCSLDIWKGRIENTYFHYSHLNQMKKLGWAGGLVGGDIYNPPL